jgi:hypothetical protein
VTHRDYANLSTAGATGERDQGVGGVGDPGKGRRDGASAVPDVRRADQVRPRWW